MAVLIYTTNNRAESSVGNVSYILRDDATDCWSTHNLPEVKDKTDALTYAEKRAFEEELTPLWGAAERRNHQRLELTYANETDPKIALENAKVFLEKNFPNAKIIYSSHKNTDNCHVHCWVDNRQTDNKKVHLSNSKFYKLGENWSKYCDQLYGTNYTEQFKESRKQHNQNKKDGIEPPKAKRHEKLKENRLKNEQRTINAGKSIIKRAGRIVNESARKISEYQQLNEYGNQLELAAIGRAGAERKRLSNAQESETRIQPPQGSETKSISNRQGTSEPSQNRSVVRNSRSTL
jgi:hypothetical protein